MEKKIIISYLKQRTKWKRQAAVGIELLAEAGNLAAVQSLCRAGWWKNIFFKKVA